MEEKNQNKYPGNHIDYFAPKVLWSVLGILFLVVVAASVSWWGEVKKENGYFDSRYQMEKCERESGKTCTLFYCDIPNFDSATKKHCVDEGKGSGWFPINTK